MPTRGKLFVSYARKDSAVLALRIAGDLKSSGYDVWLDKQQIEGGASWSRDIERAIETSDAMVALLSQASFDSRVCRGEQITALDLNKRLIPLLVQADARRPVYLAADHYILFEGAARYVEAFAELTRTLEGESAAGLARPYRQRYVTQRPLPAAYLPRESELAELRRLVIAERGSTSATLTAIRAMGGAGKTVLAGALLRDDAIRRAFPDGQAWIDVGKHPSDNHLLQQAQEAARALGEDFSAVTSVREASNRLRTLLQGKAGFLVLDDVWEVSDADPFLVDSTQSSIVLTTRNDNVARGLGAEVYELNTLGARQSLELLARWSRTPFDKLPPQADEIADECGHLPLALSMVGASLAGKREEAWQRRLERLRLADLTKIGIPLAGYAFPDVFKAIDASVGELPEQAKQAYRKLAVFPADARVPVQALEVLLGLGTIDVEDLIETWAGASLATLDTQGRIVLHDLQRDYVRGTAGDLQSLQRDFVENYRKRVPGGWHTAGEDGYLPERLLWHLSEAGLRDESEALLTDPRWMNSKLHWKGIESLLDDYRVSESDVTKLTAEALRLSSHVLARDPLALAGQLAGRLMRSDNPAIQSILTAAADEQMGSWLEPLAGSLDQPGGPLILKFDAGGAVSHFSVSPDGSRIAALSNLGFLTLLDSRYGRLLSIVRREGDPVVHSIAMLSNERVLVCSANGELQVWDTTAAAKIHEAWTASVMDMAVAPSARTIVLLAGELEIWSTETLTQAGSLPSDSVTSVAVAPDGAHVLTYSRYRGALSLRLLPGGELVTEHRDEENLLCCDAIVLAPDHRNAYLGDVLDQIYQVDLSAPATVRALRKHKNEVKALALSADSTKLLSGDSVGAIILWDLPSGEARQILGGHTEEIRELAFGGSDRAVSCANDGTLRLWDLNRGSTPPHPGQHAGLVLSVGVNAQGSRAFSAHPTEWLRPWQVGTRAQPDELSFDLAGEWWPMSYASALTWVLLRNENGVLQLLDLDQGQFGPKFESWAGNQLAALSPTGEALAYQKSYQHVNLAHLDGDEVLRETQILAADVTIRSLAFSGDGGRVAAALDGGRLLVWDTADGKMLADYSVRDAPSSELLALNPDGTQALVELSRYRSEFLWIDLTTGQAIDILRWSPWSQAITEAIVWASDANVIAAACSDGMLLVMPMDSRSPLIWQADAPIRSCALSADASVAVAGDETGRAHFLRVRHAQ